MCYKTAIIYPDGTWSVVATNTTARNCDRSHKFYERYCIQQLLKARGRDFSFTMFRVSTLVDSTDSHRSFVHDSFPMFKIDVCRHETVCFDSMSCDLFSVISFIECGHDL